MLNPKVDFRASSFHCPHCGNFTKQEWYNVAKGNISDKGLGFYEGFVTDFYLSLCTQCRNYALWINDKIIYPAPSLAPWPSNDMPLNVKEDYLEARNIVNASPRAAAAIMRVSLQKLMRYLGEKGKNMDLDISSLARKGLPERFRDAFWAVRAAGPKKVAPGKIDLADDVETAVALFNLVNVLVESTISPQRIFTVFPNQKLRRRQPRKKPKKKTDDIIPKPTLLYR